MAAPKARILELLPGEEWTALHEEVNELLHVEKLHRRENEANEGTKVCL